MNGRAVTPAAVFGGRAAGIAVVAGIAVWLTGWRGVDYPAQAYWVGLFEDHGFTMWSPGWYSGHHTPSYSVLFPLLASWFGTGLTSIAATGAAVGLFGFLVRRPAKLAAVPGTLAFGILMIINLFEGRLPFALGVAFALAGLLVGQRQWWVGAAVCGVLASLASPVAGGFFALAMGALVLAPLFSGVGLAATLRSGLWPALVSIVTVIPPAIITAIFPDGGRFPFYGEAFLITVACGVAVPLVLRKQYPAIAAGAALAGAAAVPLFFIENPVGLNLTRIAVLGGPLLVGVLLPRRSWQWLIGLFLVVWQLQPLLGVADTATDTSRNQDYFQPLIEEVLVRADGPVRVEIPLTEQHWETTHVPGNGVMLARGWNRQFDYRYNEALQTDELTDAAYLEWLRQSGVRFVALPDVALEPRSDDEAAVARASEGLRPVWQNEHWELFEVTNTAPLVSGGGSLVRAQPDLLELSLPAAGEFLVRVHLSPHFALSRPDMCIAEGPDDWFRIRWEPAEEATDGEATAVPLLITAKLSGTKNHLC